jgi:hypothetical protein
MAVQKKSTYVYRAACSRCKWHGPEGSKEQAMKEQKAHDAKHKAGHKANMERATPISQDEIDNYQSEFK